MGRKGKIKVGVHAFVVQAAKIQGRKLAEQNGEHTELRSQCCDTEAARALHFINVIYI